MEGKSERRVLRKAEPTGEPDIPYRAVFGDVSKIIDAARETRKRPAPGLVYPIPMGSSPSPAMKSALTWILWMCIATSLPCCSS